MKRVLCITTLILLSGCTATQLTQDGNVVRIIDNDILGAQVEKTCNWLGEVSGTQGNYFTADFTSESDMMTGSRNSLRNQAAKIGANTVIIQNHQTVQNDDFIGTGGHTFIGQAFTCPSEL